MDAVKPPFECKTSEEVFDLLEHWIFTLPNNVKKIFENGLTSHGINGESLIFLDTQSLEELNIKNAEYQHIIIKAINALYPSSVLSKYIGTFPYFQSLMIPQSILDSQTNLETLKSKGHEVSFYKNILNIQHGDAIREFIQTFEMIFTNEIDYKSLSTLNIVTREHSPSRSASTLPKLETVNTADINGMKQSIAQYTSILSKLRETDDAKEVLSLIEPLQALDVHTLKTEMYNIPATQILHRIMYHETSIAKSKIENNEEDDNDEDTLKIQRNNEKKISILNYMATHKMTSTLGTSLLCNEGVTLKELQVFMKTLASNKQLSVHKVSGVADSQSLLTICHRIVKAYRRQSVETIAFLVIDVDSFYQINSEYDEKVGDELLFQIGEALFETVQHIHSTKKLDGNSLKSCEFYHSGGNRFYVLISVSSDEEALNNGQIIVNMMRNKQFDIAGHKIKRTVSVGVYIYNPGLSINNIKSNAHIPLFYAKHNGKNQVISYTQCKQLQNKQIAVSNGNVWSKQLYDLVSVYAKYKDNLCKAMTKRLIVNKECNINWKNKKDGNNTILMYCLENRCKELVEFYLAHFINKLDFNLFRDDGSNALLLSIKYDFTKRIVEKILYKTDTKNRNITNKWKDNTVSLAQIKGLHHIIQSLII